MKIIENIFESQKKEKGQTGQIKIKLDYSYMII